MQDEREEKVKQKKRITVRRWSREIKRIRNRKKKENKIMKQEEEKDKNMMKCKEKIRL
jgi:hypothetical protein